MNRLRTVLCSIAVALALQFASGTLCAQAPRVLLVYPTEAEPSVSAALVRVRGELVADGFDVVLVKAQPGTSSAAAMGEAEHDAGSATVGLFLSADGTSAELWVVDKMTDKTVVRRVNTASEPSGQLSEVLAVRAVELLRASLLEFLVVQRQHEAKGAGPTAANSKPIERETARQVSEWAARPIEDNRSLSWVLEPGLGLLINPGQVDPELVLVGRLRIPWSPIIHSRASLVGLGTHPRVRASVGAATLQQWYGLGELVLLPWPSLRIRPLFTLGLGTHHINVDGEAEWPYRGVHSAAWTFALDGGTGVEVKLARRLSIAAEGHATFSSPYPLLRFVGQDRATLGHPTLMASLALAVSL